MVRYVECLVQSLAHSRCLINVAAYLLQLLLWLAFPDPAAPGRPQPETSSRPCREDIRCFLG